MSSLWRGALLGGIAGLVLLVLLLNDCAGPLEEPLTLLLIILMAIGSPFLPAGPPPGPMIVPRFGRGADIVAYIAFVLLGMGVGWIVVFIRLRANGHSMRILGWALAVSRSRVLSFSNGALASECFRVHEPPRPAQQIS